MYQEVVRFLRLKSADLLMEVALVESGVLRHEAGSSVRMGGDFPEAFESGLLTQSASSWKSDESPVLASFQGNRDFATVAKQMRRFFGSRGGAARLRALAAADADWFSRGKGDHAAWSARRKAKKGGLFE